VGGQAKGLLGKAGRLDLCKSECMVHGACMCAYGLRYGTVMLVCWAIAFIVGVGLAY